MPSTASLTEAAIRELAALHCDAGALSFYVDLDRRRRPSWEEVESAAIRLARSARHLPGVPRLDPETASDVDIVLARFGRGVDRSWARGLAVFSCRERNFYRQFVLAQPVGDLVTFGPRFRIAPLEEAIASDTPRLGALVDRQRCRLFRSRLGRTVEMSGPLDRPVRATGTDREMGGFDRFVDEAFRRHVRRAAEALAREAARLPAAPIFLGGTEPAVSAVQRQLPDAVRHRVSDHLPLSIGAPLSDVAAAMHDAQIELAKRLEAQAVDRICELADHRHGAVAGLGPALAALREHRVDTLLVSRSLAAPAASCPACGWAGECSAQCPDCGVAVEPVDSFDLSLEEAAAQRARVVFADQPRLDAVGGIAVLERF